MQHFDFALIGAGPIGIECAVRLKQHEANYIHLEAGQIGATIHWYAPGTPFFSSADRLAIAGVPLSTLQQTKPTREEYLNYLRSVVDQFQLNIHSHRLVANIKQEQSGYCLEHIANLSPSQRVPPFELVGEPIQSDESTDKKECVARKIILAIGDMHRPRMLGILGETLSHVSHYLDEPHQYFRKRVLIIGGKNSAVEAAIRLCRLGCDVTMSYRGTGFDRDRIKYWLYPELKFLIKTKKIQFLPETTIEEIRRKSVLLKNAHGETIEQQADRVLLLTGYEQNSALFKMLGLKLEGAGKKPVLNPETQESSVLGVYVLGTAVAGTQMKGVREFIETSHEHVDRLMHHLFGDEMLSPKPDKEFLEN